MSDLTLENYLSLLSESITDIHRVNYLDRVKELADPEDYVVTGSAVLALYGIRPNKDIDIIASDNLFRKITKDKRFEQYKAPSGDISYRSKDRIIEFYSRNWPVIPGGETAEQLIASADIIDNIRFSTLKQIIQWKQKYNRSKDIKDVRLIRRFCAKNDLDC